MGIKETVQRLQDRGFFKKKGGEKVEVGQIGQKATEMVRGAKDIKIAVTPRAGNPLFEALPGILKAASPDSKVEVILLMPNNFKPIEEVRETLKKTMEIVGKRNKTEMDAIADDDPDLAQINLELKSEPKFNNLVVFVQDPKKPEQYWHRMIGIEKGAMKLGDSEKEVSYVDVKVYPMGVLDSVPVPSTVLDQTVKKIQDAELWLSIHPDQDIRDMQAVVGVAKYTGNKKLSLEKIIHLTATKYSKLVQPSEK